MLQSFSSSNTHSIPIDETLEDSLIDLYLSVKIRSNDEVSFCFPKWMLIDRYVWWRDSCSWAGEASRRGPIYNCWIHKSFSWNSYEYEDGRVTKLRFSKIEKDDRGRLNKCLKFFSAGNWKRRQFLAVLIWTATVKIRGWSSQSH